MTVPGRECGACRQCCITTDIVEIGKKAGEPCKHLMENGCGIYGSRPEVCRAFECGWRINDRFRADERPDAVGIMVMGLNTSAGRLNAAHETKPGAFDSWKGDRLIKRESKRALLGLADYGKQPTLSNMRIAGPARIVGRIDAATRARGK